MKFRHLKKYIPSAFTMMNLLSGFSAIIVADLRISSYLILLGMVFDVFDGMLARMLKVSSDIGKELDSLADLVSFGVAPAFLYSLMRPGTHWSFYLPSFVLLFAAAYRLAIYNSLPPNKYFRGLATPASSFFLVRIFLAFTSNEHLYQQLISHNLIYAIIPMFLGLLMLSDIQMLSFKNFGSSKSNTNWIIIGVIILIALLVIDLDTGMVIAVIIYIIFSLIYNLFLQNNQKENAVIVK